MTKFKPTVDPNGKYELRDAAKALGIHKTTLNAYRVKGWIKSSVKKLNGRAVYSGADIIKFWQMYN